MKRTAVRRFARSAAVFLALGFAVNALVTLVIAATVNVDPDPMTRGRGATSGGGSLLWTVQTNRFAAAEYVVWSVGRPSVIPIINSLTPFEECVPAWLSVPAPTAETFGGYRLTYTYFLAMGWPWLTAWCETRSTRIPETGAPVKGGPRGGVALPLDPWPKIFAGVGLPRIMPYRPLWRGVMLNTAFYAILLAGAAAVVRNLVRARRFTRGRCPECRYDLRFDYKEGCPECGWRRGPETSAA